MSEIDADNLEGSGPSKEERAGNRRKLAKLTKQERFGLMFRGPISAENHTEQSMMIFQDGNVAKKNIQLAKTMTHVIAGSNGENKKSFAQSLNQLRKNGKFSLSEIEKVTGHMTRNVCRWLTGESEPSPAIQLEVLTALLNHPHPSKALSRHLERIHGLTYEVRKRRWRLKITIDTGKKTVGIRKQIDIGRCSVDEAIKHKEVIMRTCEAFKLKIIERKQKRKINTKEN